MRSESEAAVIAASDSFRTRPGKLTQYGLTQSVSPSSGNSDDMTTTPFEVQRQVDV
jgi:hypothetical protein